jgi:hypothetical protein
VSSPRPHQSRPTVPHLPDNAPNVTWIGPNSQRYTPLPMPKARDRSEQTQALIVIFLTFACTVMAILDLFLLAANA